MVSFNVIIIVMGRLSEISDGIFQRHYYYYYNYLCCFVIVSTFGERSRTLFPQSVGDEFGWWLTEQRAFVSWLLACFTSQQPASVSRGQTSSDSCACCHTDREVANRGFQTRVVYLHYTACLRYSILVQNPRNQTFFLTQSQHTATGPTSPSTDL